MSLRMEKWIKRTGVLSGLLFVLILAMAPFTFGASLLALPLLGALVTFLSAHLVLTGIVLAITGSIGLASLIRYIWQKSKHSALETTMQDAETLSEKNPTKSIKEDLNTFLKDTEETVLLDEMKQIDLEAPSEGKASYEQGYQFLLGKQYKKALTCFEEAAKHNYVLAYVWLHQLRTSDYFGLQDQDKDKEQSELAARHIRERVLPWIKIKGETDENFKNFHFLYALGYLCHNGSLDPSLVTLSQSRIDATLGFYLSALKINKASIFSVYALSEIWAELGVYTEAIRCLDSFIQSHDPENIELLERRKTLISKLAETPKASDASRKLKEEKKTTKKETHLQARLTSLTTQENCVDFRDYPLSLEEDVPVLVEVLKKNTTLLEIKGNEEIQKHARPYLYRNQLLAREGEITEQEIEEIQARPFNALSPEALEKLLEKASGITTLDLSGKELTLNSPFFQIKKFPVFPQLTVLNLNRNVLDDVKKLRVFLERTLDSFPKLTVLNLDDNHMGHAAFLHLSEWILDRLEKNPKAALNLHHIYLRNNFMALCDLLKSQQALLDDSGKYQEPIHFYLSGNSITERADELFEPDKEILGEEKEKPVESTASDDTESGHISLSLLPLKKRICFFHSSFLPPEVKLESHIPLFSKDPASLKITKEHLPFHSNQGLLYVASPKKSRSTLLMGEHLIICLEGMRPSGQRFVLRYEVFASEVGVLTIRKMEGKAKELTKTGAFDQYEGEYTFAPVAIMNEGTLLKIKAELDQMEKETNTAFLEKEEAKKAKKLASKPLAASTDQLKPRIGKSGSSALLEEKIKSRAINYSLSASFFKWLRPTTHKSDKTGNCVTIMLELFERFHIKIPKGTESVRPSDVRDYFLREYEAHGLQTVEESTSQPKEVESVSPKGVS